MNLFDALVTQALQKQSQLSSLRMVVEKELLHHDILKILRDHGFLKELTFIGGTCLRACYGGLRLSEDLDFTGGKHFSKEQLKGMGDLVMLSLEEKYSLKVRVSEPEKDIHNVATWKIRIETRPEEKHLPAQRIHLDICSVASYERQPMLLRNPYGVDLGTGGLIVQAQSREEIYTDKILAFALRPNRVKYRDLWDIFWLHGQSVKPALQWLVPKLEDHECEQKGFVAQFESRLDLMIQQADMAVEFQKEMSRFLAGEAWTSLAHPEEIWMVLVSLMKDVGKTMRTYLSNS